MRLRLLYEANDPNISSRASARSLVMLPSCSLNRKKVKDMEEQISWFGNTSLTQIEIDALEKAIEATQRSNISYGIYHLLEERARKLDHPEFSQDQIDAYLEARGLKFPDTIIPPRSLGGYTLAERVIKHESVLPSWWTRGPSKRNH